MKRLLTTGLLSLVIAFSVNACYAQVKKVLIVSTNVDTILNRPNGTFLMEIAYPFATFNRLGLEVDIVTPNGGKAAIYHQGTLPDRLARIQQNELFIQKTSNTLAPHQLIATNYSGIFYPGGGGQFYDVVNNPSIARIAAAIYDKGGVVGIAGHGAVSLINIQLADGSFLVNGKVITCFPKSFSAKWLPIDWEEALSARGATIRLPMTSQEKEYGIELYDGHSRIISGSYAENAQWVAEKMVTLIQNR